MSGIADDNELAAAFHQVKPAAANFGEKARAPNFALNVPDGPSHNSVFAHRFGLKHQIQPPQVFFVGKNRVRSGFHAGTSAQNGKQNLKAAAAATL
jgi:hypothetical protein